MPSPGGFLVHLWHYFWVEAENHSLSWYQPALDALTLALMRQFNTLPSDFQDSQPTSSPQPLVYATYQAYLRRVPQQLAYGLHDARLNNYALGVKLVRGAYHLYEVKAHNTLRSGGSPSSAISPEVLPPVWLEKRETDEAYDHCLKQLIEAVKEDVVREQEGRGHGASVGVLFGTHNHNSCRLVIDELVRNGLGEVVQTIEPTIDGTSRVGNTKVKVGPAVLERVAIAQLYGMYILSSIALHANLFPGMCDDLTETLASRIVSDVPMVIKYIPYGGLKEVLPYLSRRAIENKSVLGDGGAARERKRAWREISARIWDLFPFRT